MKTSNFSNIKRGASELKGFIGANLIYFIGVVVVAVIALIGIQSYFDHRQIEKQSQMLDEYDRYKEESRKKDKEITDSINQTHQATVNVLNGIKAIDGTINQLIANDKRRAGELTNLREAYNNAKQPPKTITKDGKVVYRNPRSNLPVRESENAGLRADRELYPNSN